MSAIYEVISTTGAIEFLNIAYMEIAMACVAAVVYFTLTGYVKASSKKRAKTNKKVSDLGGQKTSPRTSDQSPSPMQLLSKALRQGCWDDALPLLKQLPNGFLPATVAPRCLMAAARAAQFDEVLEELQTFSGRFEARALEAAAAEASKNKDSTACKKLHIIATKLVITMTESTSESLAKGLSSDAAALRELVNAVDTPLPKQFAKTVLEACTHMKDVDLAAEVFEKAAEADASFLRAAVEKAAASPPAVCNSENKASMQHAKEVREATKNKDFDGALKLFEKYNKGGVSSVLYNSVIDACMECGKTDTAMQYFDDADRAGVADTVSYNIMIKGYVNAGDVSRAKKLLTQLREKGLIPSQASYHVLLNYMVNKGDSRAAWNLIEDMQTAQVAPSGITCSILLKGQSVTASEVRRILKLIEGLDESMDDILFSAIAEACIRTEQWDVLKAQMAELCSHGKVLSAPTYGSLIKAYGQLRDVKCVWSIWKAMENAKVQPTAITLGCMVEALVMNRCTPDAWKLAQDLCKDEGTKPLVNTVIYSTILKGFANMKDTDKVMKLYEDMKSQGIQPNTITFNTILNAFAHGGAMHRVPALLEDMKASAPAAEPDIVTYSTIIKGFCHAGNLDQALKIMQDMQSDASIHPDEMVYNSLLDGCAREQRPDDALKLLDDMRKTGITPSNYTLSMLVKLMGRCRRLNKAFSLIDDLTAAYGLKVNIQVYTCLIQACFNNRQPAKAVSLYTKIVDEGLYPDEMTYSALVTGCLKAGLIDKAVHLVKCAHGIAEPRPNGRPAGVNARCYDDVMNALGGARSSAAQTLKKELEEGKSGKGKGSSKGNFTANAPWRA